MTTFYIIVVVAAVITALVVIFNPNPSLMNAQQQPAPQNNAQGSPPLELKPGVIVVPPSQQHPPPLAQIQADIAKHSPQVQQYVSQILREIGNGTAAQRAQMEQQLTNQGVIDCPAIANPSHACLLTPPMRGPISPPLVP
jgi:hypothetical protein